MHLEMQMLAGGIPSSATETQHLALLHLIALRHRNLRKMSVKGARAPFMRNHHVITVLAAWIAARECYRPGGACPDWRVRIERERNIKPCRVTGAKVGCDLAGC